VEQGIKGLMISGNGIAGPGAQEIAQALHTNDTLEELQVCCAAAAFWFRGSGCSLLERVFEGLGFFRLQASGFGVQPSRACF
jgi:hypothetical protein